MKSEANFLKKNNPVMMPHAPTFNAFTIGATPNLIKQPSGGIASNQNNTSSLGVIASGA